LCSHGLYLVHDTMAARFLHRFCHFTGSQTANLRLVIRCSTLGVNKLVRRSRFLVDTLIAFVYTNRFYLVLRWILTQERVQKEGLNPKTNFINKLLGSKYISYYLYCRISMSQARKTCPSVGVAEICRLLGMLQPHSQRRLRLPSRAPATWPVAITHHQPSAQLLS
jgi:hypothetical protein